jgi:hypothetical protein
MHGVMHGGAMRSVVHDAVRHVMHHVTSQERSATSRRLTAATVSRYTPTTATAAKAKAKAKAMAAIGAAAAAARVSKRRLYWCSTLVANS